MEEVIEEQMTKTGYCKLEKRNTVWKQLPNRKWICIGGGCSGASGQYDKPPKQFQERRRVYF